MEECIAGHDPFHGGKDRPGGQREEIRQFQFSVREGIMVRLLTGYCFFCHFLSKGNCFYRGKGVLYYVNNIAQKLNFTGEN